MRAGRLFTITWIAMLVASFGSTLHAEVSATPSGGGRANTLIVADTSITDGVDPVPHVWGDFNRLPSDRVLNADGELRGDGRPDVFVHRSTGTPFAVWAYNRGESHDIALSRWQTNRWSPIEFLTNTRDDDEVEPRLFVRDDGTIYVTWWIDGNDPRVEITSRAEDGEFWAAAQRINDFGEPARRPTVAFRDGTLWVAYERDATGSVFNTNQVVVRRQGQGGLFELEHVVDTQCDGNLDPMLHVRPGKFWMDWRHSPDQYGFAEIDALAGGGTNLETWTDPSWTGVETVRRRIAQRIGSNTLPVASEPGPTQP